MRPGQLRPCSASRYERVELDSHLRITTLGAALLALLSATAWAVPRRRQEALNRHSTFRYLATHPEAALQPTAFGRTIQALTVWDGKLYSGYGDYGANTGPIDLTPMNLTTGTFAASPVLTDQTEEVDRFRKINGHLFVPSIDPRGAVSTDYAEGSRAGNKVSWKQYGPSDNNTGVGMTHTFDVVTLTGTDLWLIGSQGYDAVVYRSLNSGATWVKMLSVPPAATVPGDFARFYFAGVLNHRLYVQAVNYYAGQDRRSYVFDGTSWSRGPDLLPDGFGYHSSTFAGKLIYMQVGSIVALSGLMSFNGRRVTSSHAPVPFYDYAIGGRHLYGLAAAGAIYRTSDLRTWSKLAIVAPSSARSITEYKGTIYVGTTYSKIYAAPLPKARSRLLPRRSSPLR